jgi:predicted RNase H-like HicB family nuclease
LQKQGKTWRQNMHQLSVVIEKDEFGYYAYCPALEGCQTQGDTMEDVQNNIREAVALYLETLPPELPMGL